MKIIDSQIALTLHWDESKQDEQIQFASENGYGLEIVTFSWSPIHNDISLYDKKLSALKEKLKSFKEPLSIHGPIEDIVPHSKDLAIVNLARDRIRNTLQALTILNADRAVFHTGINTTITSPTFYKQAVFAQANFWNEILDEFSQPLICLENMWEPNPKIISDIIETCAHSNLKMCFDTGHFNVYSKVAMQEFINELTGKIFHLHINDNLGDWDTHLTVGDGTFDWKKFMNMDMSNNRKLRFVIELTDTEEQKKSIKRLKILARR